MHEFPLKIVLVEYSPREKTVFVRAIGRDGKMGRLSPIHEDNVQVYLRVYEGYDNVANCPAFAGLVLEEEKGRK